MDYRAHITILFISLNRSKKTKLEIRKETLTFHIEKEATDSLTSSVQNYKITD
ncbi:hypothetical protein EMIT079MI2_90141 [Bacillus sp. IT-79MI2]